MDLSTILSFLTLVGVLMLVGGISLAVSSVTRERYARRGVVLALAGLIVAVVFFVANAGLVEIGGTEVGVVFQSVGGDPANHNLWPQPLKPGIHIIIPGVDTVTVYSTEVHNYTMSGSANEGTVSGDDSILVLTSDQQQVHMDVTVLYRVDPDTANLVYLKWKDRYESDYVRTTVRSLVRDLVGGYTADDLVTNKRVQLEKTINDTLSPEFEDNGLQLQSFQLRNIVFSPEYITAIENKQVAAQQAEQAVQEADRTRTLAQGNADAAVTAAQGNADGTVAKANGDAQAFVLRSEADAKALQMLNQPLKGNPQLIQWHYIEDLAGDVKLILVPSNSPFLFNVPNGTVNLGSSSGLTLASTATPTPTDTPTRTDTPTPTQ